MAALVVLVACGGDPTRPPGGSGGGGTSSTATTAGSMPGGATLMGVVRDDAGAALADASLGLCADACWASASAADGTFAYENVPAGDYHLDVRVNGTPGNPDQPPTSGTLSVAMTLAAGETLELPPLFVPDPGAATLLVAGSQTVSLAGLTLTADPAEWSLPFGIDTPYLSAVRVPEPQWPPNPVDGAKVIARWALNPYGTTSEVPMPLTIVNDIGLAAHDAVGVYTLNPSRGELEREATATVSPDGNTIEAPAGITQVTWIVLAE